MTWRVGRQIGRTIYLQEGDDPCTCDTLIGVMDTPDLAALVVKAVNACGEGKEWKRGE